MNRVFKKLKYILETWKPIHLCWWFKKHGWKIPKYFIGADEGANSPGTMADDSAVGTIAWANPDNAKASDNSYATVDFTSAEANSHYLKATNFGFSIPEGATINGILVEVEARTGVGANSWQWDEIKIVKSNGAIGAENKEAESNVPQTSDTYALFGGLTDLWNEIWTAGDINNANFGMVIRALSIEDVTGDASVDHIRITVYYTAGASDTCTYSGSGDWYIDSSDNCYINTDVYVPGSVNLLNRGEGALHIIDDAELSVQAINSTSTDIEVEAGSKINFF